MPLTGRRGPAAEWAAVAITLFFAIACWPTANPTTLPPSANDPVNSATPAMPLSFETVGIERVFPRLAFDRPLFLTHSGDGTDRLFVISQAGTVSVFPNDPSAPPPHTFLDLSDRVLEGSEQGLLGLAFDPAYERNGAVFVYYSVGNPRRSVVSRFTVARDNPNEADVSTEMVVLEVAQPFANHNGGMLAFGPDGYLYVGLGDGGSAGDPQGNGQNPGSLLGSLLRIDVRDSSVERPYAIPGDNPFAEGGGRPEVWAYGFRNPWRFSFDRETGDLWVGDVGQNAWEEVDVVSRGGNYGWNVMEADSCFQVNGRTCDPTGLIAPVASYDHTLGCSITGGYVYRGRAVPNLNGAYVYADYCSGLVWGLQRERGRAVEEAIVTETHMALSSFGEDEPGEVYLLDHSGGGIYRFRALAEAPSG